MLRLALLLLIPAGLIGCSSEPQLRAAEAHQTLITTYAQNNDITLRSVARDWQAEAEAAADYKQQLALEEAKTEAPDVATAIATVETIHQARATIQRAIDAHYAEILLVLARNEIILAKANDLAGKLRERLAGGGIPADTVDQVLALLDRYLAEGGLPWGSISPISSPTTPTSPRSSTNSPAPLSPTTSSGS